MLNTDDLWKQAQAQSQMPKTGEPTVSAYESGGAMPVWSPSQEYLDAQEALKEWQQQKPADYQSSYTDTINQLLDSILNREQFHYDMNADPLYQQYKDMYTQQGQKAARDVTGQMAALTGGYGNSYAATAGNQAYQSALGQLNGIVPELYGQAANVYGQQGQQMQSNLSALQNQESAALSQYQMDMNNYLAGLQAAKQAANDAFNQDHGLYQDALNKWQMEQNLALQKEQAEQNQLNWISQMEIENSKPTKWGYTGGQLAVARSLLKKSPQDALNYISQLGLSSKAKNYLKQQLGLNG